MSSTTAHLTTQLERAALRELGRSYHDVNITQFGGQLRTPVLALSDGMGPLGRWRQECRTLELARALLVEHSWGVAVEVLRHEMAHQFVDEVLGVHDEPAHGPTFRRVCEQRAIDSRASGVPAPDPTSNHQRLLDRVAKLLALAESSNEHEAQSAMAAAQRLMLKYNLEALDQGLPRRYGHRTLGQPTGRVDESQRILALILADHFFVETIWVSVWRPLEGKRGSVLEVCGTDENLELAEYVFSFLNATAEHLWRDHKAAKGIRGNGPRRSYIAGVMAGFSDKLVRERVHQRECKIVWVGDGKLNEFFRKRHPRIRWARYGSRQRSVEYGHGRRAGERIVLCRGMRQGPSGDVRRLPGR